MDFFETDFVLWGIGMKNVFKKSLSVLLAITIIFSSAYVGLGEVDFSGVFAVKARASSSYTLPIDMDLIKQVGKQTPGSYACGCFSLAYCRTLLDGWVHYWYEYNFLGTTDQWNVSAYWGKANYIPINCSSSQSVFKNAYDQINNGRPCILHVTGRGSGSSHYVVCVGYTNVTNVNSISASNILILDVVGGYPYEVENMASVGYSLCADYEFLYTNSGTVSSIVSTTSISLDLNYSTVDIGGSVTLAATVSPSNATNKNVIWTSSNTSVATVSSGTVIGVKAGVTTITATASGGQTAICKVIVFPSTATPLAIAEYNGHLYELYDYASSWMDAKAFCEARGGHLAAITSAEENEVIYRLTQNGSKDRYNIGGTDEITEGEWLWVTGEEFLYNNFQSGENANPNSRDVEDYMCMDPSTGGWADINNYAYDPALNGFICEYDNLLTCDNVTLIGNKVYELYERAYPTTVCEDIAESRGGFLLSLTSEEEQIALVKWIQENSDIQNILLGANDSTTEGKWQWLSNEEWNYAPWADGEPNDTNGIEDNAILMLSLGQWNDVAGINAYPFVIEYDLEEWLDLGNNANDIVFNELPEWANAKDYDFVTQYRYRYKETTTSSDFVLPGWILYNSEVSYGDWNSGNVTDIKPTESDVLQITETATRYKWFHYLNYYDNKNNIDSIPYGTNKGYCEIFINYNLIGVSVPDKGGQSAFGTFPCVNDEFDLWFYGGQVTAYYYQTRNKTTTNYFVKYSDWSDWSTTPVTTTDDIEVESRSVYVFNNHEHAFYDWVVETSPTCIKEGKKTRTCADCDYTETEIIPVTEHVYSSEWTVDIFPTCKTEGEKSRHCTNEDCEAKTDIQNVHVIDHKYGNWIVDDNATFIEEGSKHKECTMCGNVVIESIPVLSGFNFVAIDVNSYELSSYNGIKTDVIIPSTHNNCSVKTIGNACFKNNTDIQRVVIPVGVTEIGYLAFMNCSSLEVVSIPATVTSIGIQAFYGFTGTIFCSKDSYAHQYAIDNGINYIIPTIEATDGNTKISFDNLLIFTDVEGCNDISKIVTTPPTVVSLPVGSLRVSGKEFYGTGSTVTVFDGNNYLGDYTIIVEGDTNGDSICNVLDIFEVERASNGHIDLSGVYAMAADSNSDDIIDINDYQAVVNKALAS